MAQPDQTLLQQERSKTTVDYYFDSYSHHSIHEEMLKDKVRTESYRKAIINNAHLFKDKVVLDVGCGTGILSLFAAKAGAAKVFGIDCSGIIDLANKIVEVNGYGNVVTLIKGKVEDVTLPVDKVDIIISEWMGYFLLYESMLNTVLHARDKWLKPEGLLFPDKATMYCAMIEDEQYKADKFGFWDHVYGFDFSPIKAVALLEPVVDVADKNQICTNTCRFLDLDLKKISVADLSFQRPWSLKATRNDRCHALLVWFDYGFTAGDKKLWTSTGPFSAYTHWKQTVLYLDHVLDVKRGDTISGTIASKPNQNNHRDLDITLKTEHTNSATGKHLVQSQDFRMR